MKEPPLDSGTVQYMGGHKMYPKPQKSDIYFYEDRFVLGDLSLNIPYSKIRDIANSNEMKRDAERLVYGVIALPLALSYLWKKNHIYTIVEYDDGLDVQKIVIDFERNVNYAQALIYKKMLEYRKSKDSPKVELEPSKSDKGPSNSGSPIRF